MNLKHLLRDFESCNNHDTLRSIANHPELAENGWAVAECLVPLIRLEDPQAIEILKYLAMNASPKEMIMCCIEALSALDYEESQNQPLIIHYGNLYLDGKN